MNVRVLFVLLVLCLLVSRAVAQEIVFGFELLEGECGTTYPLGPNQRIEIVGFTTVTISAEGSSSLSQSVVVSSPNGADFCIGRYASTCDCVAPVESCGSVCKNGLMGLTVSDDPIGNPFASIIQDADGRCDNGVGTPGAVHNAGRRGFVDLGPG
jgi:hypothetical protein